MLDDNYIEAQLGRNNAFMCDFYCKIFNRVQGGMIEIDTGASSTFIPFGTLGNTEDDCMFAKHYLLSKNKCAIDVLHGVEGSNAEITRDSLTQMSLEEKMNFSGLLCIGSVLDFNVCNYYIAKECKVSISFDSKKKYALLGMDILQYFDFHIGVSNVTGVSTFIGCLKSRINDEYLKELDRHFGYKRSSYINAVMIRNYILKDDMEVFYSARERRERRRKENTIE